LEPESNVDVIEDSVDSGSEPANSEADIVPFDMGLLNQCLEKGYMQHYTAYYDKAEECFPVFQSCELVVDLIGGGVRPLGEGTSGIFPHRNT